MASRDGEVRIGDPSEDPYNALSCGPMLVIDGKVNAHMSRRVQRDRPNPRTAVALDRSGRVLLLFVIDGRQPNYSEGLTLPELARFIVEQGGWRAINMDGGGSSTLVVESENGRPVVLNTPVHGRIPPGIERPVATHFGVYAKPVRR
jgi:exopolysaccharide biosynthesis protein